MGTDGQQTTSLDSKIIISPTMKGDVLNREETLINHQVHKDLSSLQILKSQILNLNNQIRISMQKPIEILSRSASENQCRNHGNLNKFLRFLRKIM